ncbi:MAG: ABC transporter ATP-binding protein/permease [Bacilli bacterium]|nr:ABC transporter ATP-binding protein/permease [Bacilli bacterium]
MDNNDKPKKRVCLELVHIKKDYYVDKVPFTAISDLSLCFPDKGFVAILGHSGSGKTTLLNIIGGLDRYTEGDMIVDGRSTKNYKDKDWDNYRNKRVGFVFQTYNLIPHLSVLQNVVMSLQLGGLGRKEREAKAIDVLNRVGLGDLLKKRPNQLSGGQMQRVAIARALVNDPDIILADEPTGALDSATSVQVMDLIREVGKDRCVIMVTHNRELADQYADRIIEMKDGRIESDSDPLVPEPQEADLNPKGKKTSMSFWTALGSSARNIRTKKGRTALTAIACSFGIIGVALVLATSNGFSEYVGNVEVSIASSVPISISPVSYKISATIGDLPEEFPTDKNVRVYDSSNAITTPVYNNFSQEYFDYINRITDDPTCYAYGSAMSIMYNRSGLDFHFLAGRQDDKGNTIVKKIDQESSAGTLGSAISSITSLPTTIIHELYGEEEAISSLYTTIEGRYPKAANEMALVLDKYNRVDFPTMRKLGFFADDATYATLSPSERNISFSDILYKDAEHPGKVHYKCYTNSSFYQLPEKASDVETMPELHTFEVPCHGDVKIETTGKLGDPDLKVTVTTDETATKQVRSLPSPNIQDVYANDAKYKAIDMHIVGILRPTESSYIQLMPASLAYTPALTKLMVDDIAPGTPSYALGQIQKKNWCLHRDGNPDNDGKNKLQSVLNSIVKVVSESGEQSETAMAQAVEAMTNGLPSCLRAYSVTAYYSPTSIGYFTRISGYLGWCRNFGVEFELGDIENALVNMFSGDTADLFDSSAEENIMDLIAYANSYSLISSVLIFPTSLTTKETIHRWLDDWNEKNPSQEIVYSDVMKDFMGGLGTLIEVISAVLIVFASISLVVSSVMTAIITYVSVIERTKEIGVLRACGARKRDVSRLFEAECVIIGAFAGVIGIGFTVVACFPINAILNAQFPGSNLSNIAHLNPWHGLLLFGISIVLAFVSGFIPARIAAQKDPVICLRTE